MGPPASPGFQEQFYTAEEAVLNLLCPLDGCGGRVREQTAEANVPESMNH